MAYSPRERRLTIIKYVVLSEGGSKEAKSRREKGKIEISPTFLIM